MLEIIWSELTSGLPNRTELAHVVIRLIASMLLGAVVGYEREQAGKAAGLRTHMLVAMGAAMFVLGTIGHARLLCVEGETDYAEWCYNWTRKVLNSIFKPTDFRNRSVVDGSKSTFT